MVERRTMSEKENSRIVNIVASPVIYKDEFLFIKRTKKPYVGLYSMIGGEIEFGEDIEEAIVREVMEESGLKVDFVNIRGNVIEHIHTGAEVTDHFVIWICETQARSPDAKTQTAGEVRWFTKGEFRSNKRLFIPSDHEMTEEFFLRGRKRNLPVHKSKVTTDGQTYTLEYFGV